MSQRVYSSIFANVAISAVQDLFSVQATATMAFEVHEIVLGQITATSVGNLRVSLHRLPATVTVGSGGSNAAPAPHNFTDAAATVSARVNDTTQATTSGTNTVLNADVWNVINGWQYLPAPEDRYQIKISQGFICSLDTAPGSAETSNGKLTIAEIM